MPKAKRHKQKTRPLHRQARNQWPMVKTERFSYPDAPWDCHRTAAPLTPLAPPLAVFRQSGLAVPNKSCLGYIYSSITCPEELAFLGTYPFAGSDWRASTTIPYYTLPYPPNKWLKSLHQVGQVCRSTVEGIQKRNHQDLSRS